MRGKSVRIYRKRKRKLQEEETRLRITEAAVELHRTVGPANTKITDVADRAGVSRMTVYNHFPTDADLLRACSSHWVAQHEFPDPTRWAAVGDPQDRLRSALTDLYRWYRSTEDMMGNVLRDVSTVPPLQQVMEERWRPYMEQVVRILAAGRPVGPGGGEQFEAALRVVVDFHTWKVLAGSILDDEAAAELGTQMIAAVR